MRPSGVREKPPVPNSAEPHVTTTTPHLCMFFSAAQHCPASPVGWPSSRCYEPETKTKRTPAKLPTALDHSKRMMLRKIFDMRQRRHHIIFQRVDASFWFVQVTQETFPRQTSPNHQLHTQLLRSSLPWKLWRNRAPQNLRLHLLHLLRFSTVPTWSSFGGEESFPCFFVQGVHAVALGLKWFEGVSFKFQTLDLARIS